MTTPTCGAHKTDGSGDTCAHPAGWGTSHVGYGQCKFHSGATPNGIKAANRQRAAHEVELLGLPVEIDPHDALLEEVHRTAGHVRWLAAVVADLEHGKAVMGVTRTVQKADGNRDVTAEARPSVWLELYVRERKHLLVACKACIDAGIDERRVRLAEEQGRIIVDVLTAALDELGVEVTDDVAATVGRHLRAVS